MDSYKVQLFLHVLIAIVAVGVTFVYPLLQGWSEKHGVGTARTALQFGEHLEKVLVIPGMVLLFLLGVGLIFDDVTGYDDDFPWWLGVSIVWFVAANAVAMGFQRMNVKQALGALEGVGDGAAFPAAYTAASRKMQITGALLGVSVIGITFLMVWKPGQ